MEQALTPNPNTDWSARDRAVLWHPCTQMHDHETVPLIPIHRGEGVWLYDFAGKRYLDAVSSWWTNLFGHANPRIGAALKQQLDTLEHVMLAGFSHQPAIELAEELVRVSPPGLTRVFYADNGSSAVEVALKMSFHYWRNFNRSSKTRFIALQGSYHGETLGALAITDIALYRETYAPLLLNPVFAPSPDAYLRAEGETESEFALRTLQAMRKLLEQHADSTCAVIVEPLVQCAAGMRMHHPIYLTGLRALCDEFNVHLIADEIAVGFGRTGTLFACEQAAITPDFLCLSKGLTGGFLPLSAVLTRDGIYQAFYAEHAAGKAFLHSHSYTGHALGCCAALATLRIFRDEPVLERNRLLATELHRQLNGWTDHPHISDVRQTGLIAAVELVRDKATRESYPGNERRGLRVYRYALDHGVILRPLGNVVYFMPPYVITPDEIRHMTEVACAGIEVAVRD